MKVVDLHPEELIDKLQDGSLTAPERERLDMHLAQCSACRFEIAVRADLVEDAPAIAERPQLTFNPGTPRERPLPTPQVEPAPVARVSPSLRARSRSRWPLAMLAAALVLSAGGAMAAVMTGAVSGHWLGLAPQSKPVEFGVHVNESKPALKPKHAAFVPDAPDAPQPAAVASSEVSASASTLEPVTAKPAASAARLSSRNAASAHPGGVAPGQARAASVTTAPAVSSAAASSEAQTPRVDAASLFADANHARRDGNVDRAVALYRTLQSRYPNSSESELSRAMLAQLLLDRGNPEAALAGFDRYLADDTPVLSAEALVGRARALEQLGKSSQAVAAWRQVQSRFPGSVHARLAATRLAALGTR